MDGWELAALAKTGDRAAFAELYDRYSGVVFRFLAHRCPDRATAEDLTGETFVRAFGRQGVVTYRGRDVGAWFVTIARNLHLDYVKSYRYRFVTAVEEIHDAGVEDGPEAEVVRRQMGGMVRELVDSTLAGDQAEAVRLLFTEGLSLTEAAAVMGRSVGAMKALRHRALVALRNNVSTALVAS